MPLRALRRLAALLALVALVAVPTAPADAAPDRAVADGIEPETGSTGRLLATEGEGFLQEIRGQLVLQLRGTPREMGRQHGRLLADRIRENAEAYLGMAASRGVDRARLLASWEECAPFIPEALHEELRGLAEGSGLSLETVRAFHMVPTFFHCSGAAVFGPATADGRLYHFRSLDYAIGIGGETKVQENACLVVYRPSEGIPHAVVSWAGAIGCVTGMNGAGISVGEMGSSSDDEERRGLPMWFHLRRVLSEADSLEAAVRMFREWDRTCGYNFIVSDGTIPDARAIEVTRSRIAVFEPGDPDEAVEPHAPIDHCVRRVNHFVSPELAATQRDPYDPRVSAQASYLGYSVISRWVRDRFGELDAASTIGMGRCYPPGHSCLHQAVFRPDDGAMWVSNAADPDEVERAGAQNRTFYPYSLPALLETEPADLPRPGEETDDGGEDTAPTDADDGEGTVRGRTTSVPLDLDGEDDPEMREALARFDVEPEPFSWTLGPEGPQGDLPRKRLTFPSPVESGWEANDTVHALWYPPQGGEGPRPAVVVLHHLGGSFEVEHLLCRKLAFDGVGALFVWMPHYGRRRAEGGPRRMLSLEDLERGVSSVRQAVLDVRRAADWLAARPDVDGEALGIAGVSLGAIVGSLAAGVDLRFRRNAFVLGGGDLARILLESAEARGVQARLAEAGIGEADLRRALRPVEPLRFAHRMDPRGVLMLNVREDTVVPRETTEALRARIGDPRIRWYDGDHTDLAVHVLDVFERVSENARWGWY